MARSSQYPPSVDPGVPKEWPVPTGWRRVRFRDLVHIVERPVDLEDSAEYQLVIAKRSRGGIVPRGRLLGRAIRVRTQFGIEPGDFLISARQVIHGACGIVPPELAGAIVSNEYVVLQPTDGLIMEYLGQLSHTPYFQRTCFHSSIGIDVEKMVFKVDRWMNYYVPVPPVDEQQWIAAILRAADDAIAAGEAVVQQLEQVRRELASELLGRVLPGKHPSLPTRYEWRRSRIEELGEVLAGRQRSPNQQGRLRPYLRVANVLDARIDLDDVLEMPFTDNEYLKYRLTLGDVLLNEGQSRTLVGRSAVYRGSPSDCCFQNTLIRFRAGPSIDPEFAQVMFAYLQQQGVFSKIATQTTSIAHLGVRRFAELEVAVPPLDEQRAIADAITALMDLVAKEHAVLVERRRLKTALADALLSGKIRVPCAGEEAEAAIEPV